ncbi:MAG TPA: bifunctional phosphopantothenoylcysteine decarboxylase/phosphopantothenate--cysteine ligase CoaBC [Candidatus Polarisedimenticolaceae bacterium]|nr:bifunctional phosphopantothenoylcysteine decarboxylase/phosphopantothenate--cysteine ligase CoaBC [Candidatus Polarisedimenticolaceae bacterium]
MRVALGVSGGIAAYKAPEIVRGLTEAGCQVRVILTRNAEQFVTPLTLQTLSRRKVLREAFALDAEETVRHVELARELDAMVVAPATANVLGKFAHGIADDLLSTFHLAVTAPVVLAPAMNTRMWAHPAVRESVALLRARGVRLIDPESGWLAENEIGVGRMADPTAVVAATLAAARRGRQLQGKRILVTAGPTREPLDPVRYLSNRSSGKMGYALAEAAARRGASVLLVSGPVALPTPYGVEIVRVQTAREMREAVLGAAADAVFMAAAVADHAPEPAPAKIKKSAGALTLTLAPGPDILAELGERKARGAGPLLVGFAAETEDLLAGAQQKLEAKNLDFIVANDVSRADAGIDADRNEVTVLDRDGGRHAIPLAAKRLVAESILDRVFGAEGA